MQSIRILCAAITSIFALSACDPNFETTAQKCRTGQASTVIVGVPSYEVQADEDEYRLYLERTLELMEPSEVLDAEEQAALDFVRSEINAYLDYVQTGGSVTSATNPVDYLESLVATTDPDKEIEAFVIAKNQLAQGIADDDDFCSYTNPNIILTDGSADANVIAYAELSMSYDPFNRIVQQSILVADQSEDLGSSATRQTVPYVGFFQALPQNYTARGYTEPEVRQFIANSATDSFASLSFDEGTDTKLGQVLLDYRNEFCDTDSTSSDTGDFADCGVGITTRVPAKTDCSKETNKLAENTFDLTPTVTGKKRLRVEADFTTGEVRIYVSSYQEAIYDSDDTTIIEDPTDCEKQAVLDELAAATPGVGVRLTLIPDSNFDIVYETDSDGNQVLDSNGDPIVESEPTPAFSYQGTL